MTKTEKWLTGIVIVETAALAYYAYEWYSSRAKVMTFVKANAGQPVPLSELPKGWVTVK